MTQRNLETDKVDLQQATLKTSWILHMFSESAMQIKNDG